MIQPLRLQLAPQQAEDCFVELGLSQVPARRWQRIFYDTPRYHLWSQGHRLYTRRLQRSAIDDSGAQGAAENSGCPSASIPVTWPGDLKVTDFQGNSLGLQGLPIKPIFQVDLERRSRTFAINPRDSLRLRAETATICTGDHVDLLYHLIVRSQAANPSAMYEWLEALAIRYTLILNEIDLVTRGYGLLIPTPITSHKAQPLSLNSNDSTEAAFMAIVQICGGQIRDNWSAIQDHQVEGVHQMRV